MSKVRFTPILEPTVPASGKVWVYVDQSDNHIKSKDYTGSIFDLTSGTSVLPLVGVDGITITSGVNFTTIQGFRPEFVSASGFLQTEIDGITASMVPPAIVPGSTNVTIISGTNTTSVKVDIPPAIVGGSNITVISGANTITVSSTALVPNALIGTDGITIISGSNTTTVQGFRTEFVSASGFIQNQINNLDATYATDAQLLSVSGHLQTQINSINVDDIEPAIIAGSTNVTIISGTNTTTVKVDIPPAIVAGSNISVISGTNTITISSTASGNALVGADGITIISGSNTTTISGFRTEFVSASGFLQNQISNLDATYATDVMVISISGHLQTAIDAVEATDVDSLNGAVGALTLVGGNIEVSTAGQTIIISAPVPNALISAGNITITSGTNQTFLAAGKENALIAGPNIQIVSGTNTTTITASQPPAIVAGSNISVVSGSNTITISSTASGSGNAIVGDSFINVISGSNTIQIAADAITGSDGITVSTGTSTVNVAGFRAEFVLASGFLQTQITTADADVSSLNSLQGAVVIASTNIGVSTAGQNINLSAPVPDALVGGSNITIVSGSNTTTIVGAQPPAIISANTALLTVTSGSNTITLNPAADNAIVGGTDISVVSGTNTITISSTASAGKPLVGDSFISVVTGTNQVNILADAIIGGSNVSVVSGTSTVTITASQPPALLAGQNIVITSGSNTITIAANPASAPALIGGSNITIVSGSNTTTIVGAQPPAIVSGDNFLNVVSGSNTITITPDAIISSSANLTITSGTNTLTLGFSATPSFTSLTATTITGTTFQAAGQISGQSGLFSTSVQATTVTGNTGQFAGQLTSQSAIVSTNIQALTVQGTTITGTTGQFAGTVSAQGGNFSTTLTISGLPVSVEKFRPFQFFADQFDSPVTADWAVNAFAAAVQDTNNSALTVRLFDDTTEEGVGWALTIPTGATRMNVRLKSRAETAPAAVRTVGLKLYKRKIADNTAVGAWDAGTVMTDLSFPANENFQYDVDDRTLTTWGLVAESLYQFELTRVNPVAGTELVGDWALLSMDVEFR